MDLTGRAKLMDFGIARTIGNKLQRADLGVSMPESRSVPHYMAPEQVLGGL